MFQVKPSVPSASSEPKREETEVQKKQFGLLSRQESVKSKKNIIQSSGSSSHWCPERLQSYISNETLKNEDGTLAVGVYTTPIRKPVVAAGPFLRMRKMKEWHYTSLVVQDRWFLAFAIVDMQYLSTSFAYLVDLTSGEKVQFSNIYTGFQQNIKIASSSCEDMAETTWTGSQGKISAQYIESKGATSITVDVTMPGSTETRVKAKFFTYHNDALALVFPLRKNRVAYTHKEMGMVAQGTLQVNDESFPFEDGLSAFDWTRSQARRETRWKWVSMMGVDEEGRRIGLNLSSDVYDSADGESQENGLWLDGKLYRLGPMQIVMPEGDPRKEDWIIKSAHNDFNAQGSVELYMEFTPMGAWEEHVNVLVLATDFVQPYGRFTGYIKGGDVWDFGKVTVNKFPGVVENHYAKW